MNDIWIIAIVVVLVLAGALGYPYAKRKGWIKDENVTGAKKVLEFFNLIMAVINLDDATRNRTKFILDIAANAVSFFAGLSDPSVNRKSLSLEAVNKVLREAGITPTTAEQVLIERLIAEVLDLQERQ